ncbi:MAG: BrnA antitoxin family protein [Paracoccaceae bacterium]
MLGTTRRGTKLERLANDRMIRCLNKLDEEDRLDYAVRENIPAEWTTLEEDIDVEEPKVKVTLLLDKSVANFYRSMGRGYQARVNRVLATFAQMRMSQVKTDWDRLHALNPRLYLVDRFTKDLGEG